METNDKEVNTFHWLLPFVARFCSLRGFVKDESHGMSKQSSTVSTFSFIPLISVSTIDYLHVASY